MYLNILGKLSDGSKVYEPGQWNDSIGTYTFQRDTNGVFVNGVGKNLSEAYNTKDNIEDDPTNYLQENMNKTCSVLIAKQSDPGKFILKAADCTNGEHLLICRTVPINTTSVISNGVDENGFPCQQESTSSLFFYQTDFNSGYGRKLGKFQPGIS